MSITRTVHIMIKRLVQADSCLVTQISLLKTLLCAIGQTDSRTSFRTLALDPHSFRRSLLPIGNLTCKTFCWVCTGRLGLCFVDVSNLWAGTCCLATSICNFLQHPVGHPAERSYTTIASECGRRAVPIDISHVAAQVKTQNAILVRLA